MDEELERILRIEIPPCQANSSDEKIMIPLVYKGGEI